MWAPACQPCTLILGALYSKRGITGTLYGTFVGGGYYDKSMAALIENDHVSHVWHLGARLSWDVPINGGHIFSVYANVSNLLNQAPPQSGLEPSAAWQMAH